MSNKIKISLVITLITSTLFCSDIENGKELFNEAKCMDCHNVVDFKVKKNKITSIKKLHDIVTQCAFRDDIEWFDDDTEDVVNYLNNKYYKLKN